MFSCDCLNVKGDIVGGSENICNNPQIIALSSSSQDYCEFFKSVCSFLANKSQWIHLISPTLWQAISLPISQTSITIQHDALMQNNLVGKWNVLKCLNCDSYVYAFDKAEESILLNAALIVSDQLDLKLYILIKTIHVLSATKLKSRSSWIAATSRYRSRLSLSKSETLFSHFKQTSMTTRVSSHFSWSCRSSLHKTNMRLNRRFVV